jgi:hypothetical protein
MIKDHLEKEASDMRKGLQRGLEMGNTLSNDDIIDFKVGLQLFQMTDDIKLKYLGP